MGKLCFRDRALILKRVKCLTKSHTDGVDLAQEAIEMIDYQHPELEPELEEEGDSVIKSKTKCKSRA